MPQCNRRRVLQGLGSAVAVSALPMTGFAATEPKKLRFYHTHTRERFEVVYHDGRSYLEEGLTGISRFLRDFRTRESHPIDPVLLDLLHQARTTLDADATFEVISGYRSPATNEMLRQSSTGVARQSLHMQGRAIDVRLKGTSTDALRGVARDLEIGGVGYYPRSDFVHLDTGKVRFW